MNFEDKLSKILDEASTPGPQILGKRVIRDGYIVVVKLSDGTLVNEVTLMTGPGLGAETELECARALSETEQKQILDLTSMIDVSSLPDLGRIRRFQVQQRF